MSDLPEPVASALDELEACCNRSWTGFAHEKRLELEAEIGKALKVQGCRLGEYQLSLGKAREHLELERETSNRIAAELDTVRSRLDQIRADRDLMTEKANGLAVRLEKVSEFVAAMREWDTVTVRACDVATDLERALAVERDPARLYRAGECPKCGSDNTALLQNGDGECQPCGHVYDFPVEKRNINSGDESEPR
jgi:hypothetical protein